MDTNKTDSQTSLTIVTFNMLGTPYAVYKTPTSRILSRYRRERFQKIAEELNNSEADIICLQEVHTYPIISLLKRLMPNYPFVTYSRFIYGPKGGLVTFSKYPFANSEYINFYKKGSFMNKSFVAKLSRKGTLFCKLKDLPLYIVNTHLTANIDWDWSSTNRYIPFIISQLDQLKDALSSLSEFPLDIILTGDFNVPKHSNYYKSFVEHLDITDVFSDWKKPTYHEEHLPKGQLPHCIDYIFYIKNNLSMQIIKKEFMFDKKFELDKNIYSYLSDHVGLKAQLKLITHQKVSGE